MIAEQLRKLVAYNEWAWQRLFASAEKLNQEEYTAERPAFWGSIHGTLVHCMSAEYLWTARCLGDMEAQAFGPNDFPDFAAVRHHWAEVNGRLQTLVAGLHDEDVTRMVEHRNARGRGFSLPLVDVLQQVANHATEHRSQLTPILHQLGVPTAPLDYMRFVLKP